MSEAPRFVPISDLAEINPRTVLPHRVECSFIGMEDISEEGQWIGNSTRSSDRAAGYTAFRDADVLFAKITPCMENGKGALVSGLESGYGIGSTEFHILRARKTSDPRFIAQWTQSRALRAKAEAYMTGSAGQRRVPGSFFEAFRVPYFPLSEQRKIAEILDTADEAIQSTERLIAKLEQTKHGLLRDLLTCGIDDNGHVRDIHQQSSHTDPVLGRHPSGWKVRCFGALARYLNGYAFKPEDWVETGYPIIRIQNLNGSSNFNYYDGPVHPDWLVRPGDLLFAWSGTRDSSFGPTIWRGPQGVLNQHIFEVYENDSIVTRSFLYLLLRYCLDRITASAHGFKDSFVHVKRSELTSVPVAVPPINEQQEILRITESQDRLIEAESFKLERLRLLRTGLRDDLLTGRVRAGASG